MTLIKLIADCRIQQYEIFPTISMYEKCFCLICALIIIIKIIPPFVANRICFYFFKLWSTNKYMRHILNIDIRCG